MARVDVLLGSAVALSPLGFEESPLAKAYGRYAAISC